MRFPAALAKVLAQILVALAFLAAIVTGIVSAALLVVYFNNHGVPLDAYEMGFLAKSLTAFAGSLAAVWLSIRFQRRLDSKALRYQPPTPRAEFRISIATLTVLALLFFFKTKGNVPERMFFVAAACALVWLGLHLLIFLHELGHLALGSLAGLELQKLQVGTGPLILRRTTRTGFIWEWRLKPRGGIVIGWPGGDAPERLRNWLFIAGGPLAGILAAAALFMMLVGHNPLYSEPAGWAFTVESAGGLLLLFTVSVTLGALLPHTVLFSGLKIRSDGAQLLALLRPSKVPALELKWARRCRQISFYWITYQRDRAWTLLRVSLERDVDLRDRLEFTRGWFHLSDEEFPEAIASLEIAQANAALPAGLRLAARAHLACGLVAIGKIPEARLLIAAVLAEASGDSKVDFLDLFAWLPPMYGASEFLADAGPWIAEAIRLSPRLIRLRATEVALLAERGEIEKAEPALRKVLHGNHEDADRGIAAFYLALILQRRNAKESKIAPLRKQAVKLCPQPWLFRRIRTELEPAESTAPSQVRRDVAT